jgi:photosystem II stability/assembly factor-like uncharacterized protein
MKEIHVLSARLFGIAVTLILLTAPWHSAANAAPPRYKAIWEPINYPADVQLISPYFANGRVGWIGGAGSNSSGGVILHTEDGGGHWNIQLGDPNSNEKPFDHLYFLDARHGWAVQDGAKIVHTSDGKNWVAVGSFPKFQPLTNYVFISPQHGVEIAGYANSSRIFSTHDGGRSWKEDFQCATQLQVNGLTRRLTCSFMDLQFPSANVGYAVGGAFNGGFSVIAKTENGGATWRMIFASTDIDTIESVFFTNERHGVIRLQDRKLLVTSDGGHSWRGVPYSANGLIKFADPSVGWSCGENSCAVTADGGEHWTSRDLNLPARVSGFSAARRDRVFLVGNHGMIYRYRIVPANYTAKRIVAAPLVPGYGGELTTELARIRAKAGELQAMTTRAPNDAFVQDTNFTQDVSQLESDAGTFSQQAPAFASRYRNLNLLFVGMNMPSELGGRADAIRSAVQALKRAPDRKSAAAALQDLVAKLDDTSAMIASDFQDVVAPSAPTATSGAVTNMMAPSGAAAPAPSASSSGSNQAADQAAHEVKDVLKGFFHKRF